MSENIQLNLCKTATLKKTEIGFQNQLWLNAGQKYCRMLPGEYSAILLTFIKLPFVIKIVVLSIFEWLFYTGFTVHVQPIAFISFIQHFGGMHTKLMKKMLDYYFQELFASMTYLYVGE